MCFPLYHLLYQCVTTHAVSATSAAPEYHSCTSGQGRPGTNARRLQHPVVTPGFEPGKPFVHKDSHCSSEIHRNSLSWFAGRQTKENGMPSIQGDSNPDPGWTRQPERVIGGTRTRLPAPAGFEPTARWLAKNTRKLAGQAEGFESPPWHKGSGALCDWKNTR